MNNGGVGKRVISTNSTLNNNDSMCYANKLPNYGISGDMLRWFGEFLSNRDKCVLIEWYASSNMQIDLSVPQCTALGPLKFHVASMSSHSMCYPRCAIVLTAVYWVYGEWEIFINMIVNNKTC